MASFAAAAAAAALMCSAAMAQDTQTTTTTTTNKTVTTVMPMAVPQGMDMTTDWTDRDRQMWLIRNLRPSDRMQLKGILDEAPGNIEGLLIRGLSGVQHLSYQQLASTGTFYSLGTTTIVTAVPSTTVTTTTTSGYMTNPPAATQTTSTTTTATANTQTMVTGYHDWTTNVGYKTGRMNDFQAFDTLTANFSEGEKYALKHWMDSQVNGDYDLILRLVKDSFDANADNFPYALAWNRAIWTDRTWVPGQWVTTSY